MSPTRPKCSQRSANGKPCRNYAIAGSDRCAAHLRLTGPKTTLTSELIDRLAAWVVAGNHVSVACAAVGIPKQTFSEWMKRAERDDERSLVYRILRDRISVAEAEAETRFALIVSREANTDVAWAAWMLERKWPERWARMSQRLAEEPEVDEDDPFLEVDQLAEQRRKRIGHQA